MNILRRISLPRLLALCGGIVLLGAGATALAATLGGGPTPAPKPLAEAIHDALTAPAVAGVTARIKFTDNLIEASSLNAQGGDGAVSSSSPLVSGGSGRLWISDSGEVRMELQSEQGDTQILYDDNTISLYDAASNSLYRYTLPAATSGSASAGASRTPSGSTSSAATRPTPSSTAIGATGTHGVPSVARIQEAITGLMGHVSLSGAQPGDIAGQPTYTVTISQLHQQGLLGSVQLAWDALHGIPLRLAVYSTQSTTPVLELKATEVSYGSVESSVFELTEPPGVKVTEIAPPAEAADHHTQGAPASDATDHGPAVSGLAAVQADLPFTIDAPAELDGMARGQVRLLSFDHKAGALITYGHGLGGIAVVEGSADSRQPSSTTSDGGSLEGELPKVSISGATATVLPTALGTLLSFQRSSVDYLVAASLPSSTVQAAARGL